MKHVPLFVQALGLVIATLLAVVFTTTLIILRLPPPRPDIYTVAEVAKSLETGRAVVTGDGQALEVARSVSPPAARSDGRNHVDFRDGLAVLLKRRPEDIVVVQNERRIVAFRPREGTQRPPAGQPLLFGQFRAALRQPDGGWTIVSPPHPLIDAWQVRILLSLGFAALVVTPLAWIYSRRMAAPIVAFATAAERLGRNPGAPPLDMKGSCEVGIAVAAFNQMQERLERYVDLRTPLTRLRFRVEAAPVHMRAKLVSDIDEMEAMIAATLAFVKDAGSSGGRTRLEVASMVETVVEDIAETGADATVESARRVVVDADPIALKRLLMNLVDNALKFGSRARCRVYADAGMAVVEIDDNGPGVPECDWERAFEPFHRLETSRSRETGGSGLGLAVVRAIARGHGGEVTLGNLPEGGLRARLVLPLAAQVRRTAAAA